VRIFGVSTHVLPCVLAPKPLSHGATDRRGRGTRMEGGLAEPTGPGSRAGYEGTRTARGGSREGHEGTADLAWQARPVAGATRGGRDAWRAQALLENTP